MGSRVSDPLEGANSLHTTVGRLESFQISHAVKDKNASTNKKRAATTVTWPHKLPDVELLASAGFYYKPTSEYRDSTKCFSCRVCVDGWEESDDPIDVHFQFAPQCVWAMHLAIGRRLRDNEENVENEQDPMSDELVDARTTTFGDSWPYEGKKGWKCKIKKLVEAGWCYDPSPEYNDGVRCFYCDLMLDGWEPKDDPHAEHLRRRPDCPFFILKDKFAASRKQTKGKKGRTSRVSKVSRVSTDSVMTTFSEAPSMMSFGDDGALSDDSVMSTATTASRTAKGRKTAKGRTTGVRKTSRSTRLTTAADDTQLAEDSVLESNQSLYPDLSLATAVSGKPKRKARKGAGDADTTAMENSIMESQTAEAIRPKRIRTKKGTAKDEEPHPEAALQSAVEPSLPDSHTATTTKPKKARTKKAPTKSDESLLELPSHPVLESSLIESQATLPARSTRGRAPKGTVQADESQASMNYEILGESSIISQESVKEAGKPKRGTKRTSDGRAKEVARVEIESIDTTEPALIEEDIPDVKPKRARTRKAQPAPAAEAEEPMKEVVQKAPAKTTKKATAKGRKGTKKASQTVLEPEVQIEDDVEAVDALPPQDNEYPGTPTTKAHQPLADVIMSDADALHQGDFSEPPLRNTTPIFSPNPPSPAMSSPTPVRVSNAQRASFTAVQEPPSAPGTPQSTQSSDAENKPPSSRPSSKRPPLSAQLASASSNHQVTRVPLAQGTPNVSPTKRAALVNAGTRTPGGRLIGHLKSTVPWTAADLEDIFLSTPVRNSYLASTDQANAKALTMRDIELPASLKDKENRDMLREVVARVQGAMSAQEKTMTVEEWVKWNAARGEERLKRECEALVGVFEKEGLRALTALEGIEATI